ncbi:uncharacterized protein LOC126808484 [Patella vulgata]|uniref:uncharacterized protein LOC126808484 n=1 Tax=Patella vulgata TaxID=6465 RepID=UPI00217FA838|nr:uncharacterized protein LOC126808484 [Patella vulgata]
MKKLITPIQFLVTVCFILDTTTDLFFVDSKYTYVTYGLYNNATCSRPPLSVFERYGFLDKNIPQDLSEYQTAILPESSIVMYLDEPGKWKRLAQGYYSIIYLGEIKATKTKVIIKEYTKKPDFHDIEDEARIMMYMSDYFPNFLGYVSHGTHMGNMSLVIEYIQNGETLLEVTRHDDVTKQQLLSIWHQLALAIQAMHTRFVLHNDLHLTNIMVQWKGDQPIVRMIDTGLSTFRKGMIGRIDTGYQFYPPEYGKWKETNPSMDIYGLGYIFDEMNQVLKNEDGDLQLVIDWCLSPLPKNRPSIHQLVERIGNISQNLQHLQKKKIGLNGGIKPGRVYNIFKDIKVPLLVSREITPIPSLHERKLWVNLDEDKGIYRGLYKNIPVTIHVFFSNDSYFDLHTECVSNTFASIHGFAPKVYGIHVEKKVDEDVIRGFVQEHVSGYIHLNVALDTFGHSNWNFSYRVEIAHRVVAMVQLFHKKKIYIDNIHIKNILYRRGDGSQGPKIMFADLSKTYDASDDTYDDFSNDTLRPPEPEEHVASWESDILALGAVLKDVFENTSSVPPLLNRTIFRMMNKNPELRPSNKSVMECLDTFKNVH